MSQFALVPFASADFRPDRVAPRQFTLIRLNDARLLARAVHDAFQCFEVALPPFSHGFDHLQDRRIALRDLLGSMSRALEGNRVASGFPGRVSN
jgi:hypothetical protein